MKSIENFMHSNLLVLPMVLHWLLPDSIESSLYVSILGISYFLPNLSYLFYIVLYPVYTKTENVGLSFRYRYRIVAASIFFLVYIILNMLLNNVSPFFNVIFNNCTYIFFPILFAIFPLDVEKIGHVKYILIFSLLFVFLELLLYGLGILHYKNSANEMLAGQNYNGVMRISTTVGAATGTAILVIMLGALGTLYFKVRSVLNILVLVITTIAVLLTVSRGSILTWFLFLIYYIDFYFFKNKNIVKKMGNLFVIVIIALVFANSKFVAPVMQRSTDLKENVATGRDARYEKGLNIYSKSKVIGVGFGQVFPDKSIQEIVGKEYRAAPHNSYIVILAELGVLGICFFALLVWSMGSGLILKNPYSIFSLLLLVISFNTEGVPLSAEFFSLFTFMIMTFVQIQNFNDIFK